VRAVSNLMQIKKTKENRNTNIEQAVHFIHEVE
jgi:hypothetical protein